MADKIDFYQIYWKEEQKSEIFDFATPYYNETLTPFFENSIIAETVMKSTADKIAVCSWALRRKMTQRIPPRRDLTQEVLQETFDVMSFTRNSTDHDMLAALEAWHPGSKSILRRIFDELSLPMPPVPQFPIYQNAFCATREVYQEYVAEFLEPAINLMQMDEEIRELCWKNSGYTRTTLNFPVDLERINKFLGVSYYPLHPFLLERCFSLWIDLKRLKVVYL